MKEGRLHLVVFAAALAVLALHASRYLPFIADDALISLRYAQRLLEGHGLSWTDGERVEGYSNLLWVLAAAALGALGVELIAAVRILGMLGMGAAIAAVVWVHGPSRSARGSGARGGESGAGEGAEAMKTAAAPPADEPSFAARLQALVPPLGAALALALAGPIAVWAIGGLEQAFVAAFLAWALVLAYPLVDGDGERVLPAAVPLALLVLTRPDGPIFTAAIALAIVVCRGSGGLGTAARLIVLPFAAFVGQLGFRLSYYGEWVANTARAKVVFSLERLGQGLAYLGGGGLWLGGLVLLALGVLFVGRDQRVRRRALLLLLPLAFWLAYVAAVGGDIFPGRRHLVPAVVILALLGAEFLRWATSHRSPEVRLGGAALGLLALTIFAAAQWRDPHNHRAIHERWEWDGRVVGHLLRDAFSEKAPLLAVDPAGCLPFFSSLPSLDMLGLNDGFLAKNPPPGFGEGFLGHELGDGAYVLSRNPDLVVFCLPGGGSRPCFRSGRELIREPRFRREWSLLTFEAHAPHRFTAQIWVRKEGGGKLGIERGDRGIVIPGYFFATASAVSATLGPDGRIGAHLEPGRSGKSSLAVGAGSLVIEADASDPIELELRQAGRRIAAGAPPLQASVAEGELVITATSTTSHGAHLRELRLLPAAIPASTRARP